MASSKRIDVDGGAVQILATATLPRGGTWNGDDTILFAPATGVIFRMSATGGEPTPVTKLEGQQANHSFPRFLPDGDHFLYYASGAPGVRGHYVDALRRSDKRRLLDADSAEAFASLRAPALRSRGTLFAQPLDPARLELSGSPFRVAEAIAIDPCRSGGGCSLGIRRGGTLFTD
jgi:hypothetical protein